VRESPVLVSVEEFATLLGAGRDTVYRMVHAGELRHVRFGRVIRIPRDEAERWVRDHAEPQHGVDTNQAAPEGRPDP
jgi:excisionase family DNA binding protein